MITVLLADDQSLVRSGFRMLIDSADDMETVGEVDNGRDAVAEHFAMIFNVHALRPDLPSDAAIVRARVRAATMAGENVLHDRGVIPITSSDAQGMGRAGETVRRTFQLAAVSKPADDDSPHDNARVLLATILASAGLGSGDWDKWVLRGLLANLRTTGRLGFREDRVDVGPLEARGWKAFADAQNVNYSPHFDSYLWACNLWAYKQTGQRAFLESTRNAIRMTMEQYPAGWRWQDSIERARMLLCLAWLLRVDDTPEHREWLSRIAGDLIERQDRSGALQEKLAGTGGGHYLIPQSNETYGTGETPLIQKDGDPASDQLYTAGFALLGFHEAFAATGDARLKAAEDRLADFLCRVQVRSDALPWLDGCWFRAFDFRRWDYWASSADAGWGAWSVETGWGAAWTAAVLALRAKDTSFWDFTAGSAIERLLSEVTSEMAVNTGGPWQP